MLNEYVGVTWYCTSAVAASDCHGLDYKSGHWGLYFAALLCTFLLTGPTITDCLHRFCIICNHLSPYLSSLFVHCVFCKALLVFSGLPSLCSCYSWSGFDSQFCYFDLDLMHLSVKCPEPLLCGLWDCLVIWTTVSLPGRKFNMYKTTLNKFIHQWKKSFRDKSKSFLDSCFLSLVVSHITSVLNPCLNNI